MSIIRDPLRGIVRPEPSHTDEEILDVLCSRPVRDWAVLTGAGFSTDSGLPDYRGPSSVNRRPMTFQQLTASRENHTHYWARSWMGWSFMRDAQPNEAHLSLAQLYPAALLTQNVDGLHQKAGSRGVLDLHGRLDRVVCLDCRAMYDREWVQQRLDEENANFLRDHREAIDMVEIAPDGDVPLQDTADFRMIDCPACGGLLKPDVVFFGETVPKERSLDATAAAAAAPGLIVAGTSLAVMSGLRFVRQAAKEGRPVVIITDGPTRADELADYRSLSRVGEFFRAWKDRVLR